MLHATNNILTENLVVFFAFCVIMSQEGLWKVELKLLINLCLAHFLFYPLRKENDSVYGT